MRGVMLVVEEEFFGVDDCPENVFIALPLGLLGIERLCLD